MTIAALSEREISLIITVLQRHPDVIRAKLFGSRAKGNSTPQSDVDLAVWGNVDAMAGQRIAADLEELPLPYHFDVIPFELIQLAALRDHIERVGIPLYSK